MLFVAERSASTPKDRARRGARTRSNSAAISEASRRATVRGGRRSARRAIVIQKGIELLINVPDGQGSRYAERRERFESRRSFSVRDLGAKPTVSQSDTLLDGKRDSHSAQLLFQADWPRATCHQ